MVEHLRLSPYSPIYSYMAFVTSPSADCRRLRLTTDPHLTVQNDAKLNGQASKGKPRTCCGYRGCHAPVVNLYAVSICL